MNKSLSGLALGIAGIWLFMAQPPALGDELSCSDTMTWDGGNETPYCPSYSVAQNFDADNCEFYVDSFAQAGFSADGATEAWIEAHIQVGSPQGTIVGMGMYTHIIDQDGTPQDIWDFGTETAPSTWDTGHIYGRSGLSGNLTTTVEDFAFFIDVQQAGGDVIRLWVSSGGANFTLAQVFAAGETQQNEGDSWYDWANDPSPIFDQKHACGH